jgi:hypothetical protein
MMIGQPQMMMQIPWNKMMVGSFLLSCHFDVVILLTVIFYYIVLLHLSRFKREKFLSLAL